MVTVKDGRLYRSDGREAERQFNESAAQGVLNVAALEELVRSHLFNYPLGVDRRHPR